MKGYSLQMVRIITNGKYRKITCSCGCIYSFDLSDIIKGTDGKSYVVCPECATKNTPTTK